MASGIIRHFASFYYTLRRTASAIIPVAMQVYAEFALLENFCMDFTLLYCAKLASGNRAGRKRIAAAAVLGAGFAVAFPLLSLFPPWDVAVKILSGILLCLLAGKFSSLKGFLKFSAAFFAFSAVLAGAILGIFSLAGVSYAEGNGYILSSVPVGIPLFGALMLVFAARALKNRLSKVNKKEVKISLCAGEKTVELGGFFDTGNKVYFGGEPVSVIPLSAAEKLVDANRITECVKIHTVAGSKSIKIFTADRLEIDYGDKKYALKNVKIGISSARIDRAVLHPDIMEE